MPSNPHHKTVLMIMREMPTELRLARCLRIWDVFRWLGILQENPYRQAEKLMAGMQGIGFSLYTCWFEVL
jgi:hypothetical protein